MSMNEANQAAAEIARALPFAQKFTNTWAHFCEYRKYTGTGEKREVCQSRGYRTEYNINGAWVKQATLTRALKKLLKK